MPGVGREQRLGWARATPGVDESATPGLDESDARATPQMRGATPGAAGAGKSNIGDR